MSTAALNVVELLSGKAPALVGWLQVPLTPSRVAAIAAFETRHRVEIMPHLLDALDDIIFDKADRRSGGTNRRSDDTTPPSTQRTA